MNADQFFKNHDEKPFHSNEYARTSSGDALESTSAQTFGQRAHIERTRSVVPRYGSSHIGQGYIHRSVTPRSGGYSGVRSASPVAKRNAGPAAAPRPQSFREPPARHNPFQ